jgi:hypothetical protein
MPQAKVGTGIMQGLTKGLCLRLDLDLRRISMSLLILMSTRAFVKVSCVTTMADDYDFASMNLFRLHADDATICMASDSACGMSHWVKLTAFELCMR